MAFDNRKPKFWTQQIGFRKDKLIRPEIYSDVTLPYLTFSWLDRKYIVM